MNPKTPSASAASWSAFAPQLTFVAALLVFHLTFGSFFPNRNGGLGHDYSYVLPTLLAGHYWYAVNGPLAIPWFTPAICGGVPLLADPQSFYYSVPQWLAF